MGSWDLYAYAVASLTSPFQQGIRGYLPPHSGLYSSDASQLVYVRTNIAGYFFDAVLREEHITALRITEHPVQTGANISDHAFQLPVQLMMEIGMSDVMDSMVRGQFQTGQGKSVSAYQTLVDLQAQRSPLRVVTKLNAYENMLIEHISSPVSRETTYGMRAVITLRQIITAQVPSTMTDSAAPQTTDQTDKGEVPSQTQDDSSVLYQMFGISEGADW